MGDNLPAVDLGTHRDRLVDAEVKRSTDAGYVGAGTYNTTGAGQTVGADVVREQTASFNVRFTNRSTGTDSITVHGEGGQADYGVTWLNGNTDVTNAVVSGTHVFGNVAPGATVNLTLLVNVGATATNGQQLTVHVQGASSHDPTKVDTAGATVTAVVPPYSIDAGVKRSADSSYTGANTYNGTGAGQTVAANVVRGAGTTFDVQFTNRSTLVDSITVQGEGSVANFPVTYRVGGADVTAAVVAGTQRFDNVASGANVTMTVQIGVGAGATAGTSRTVHVRGTSTHDATKSDTVGATVTATDTFMVDSQIRRSGTATFVGTDTYNTTGVGQKVKSDVRRQQTGSFDVRFINRSTATDTITVHGNAGATGFKVRYFDGATEVTNQVVAGTYQLTNVAAGGSRTLTVRIKVKAGTALGATTAALVTGTSSHDASKVDAVKAKVRAVA